MDNILREAQKMLPDKSKDELEAFIKQHYTIVAHQNLQDIMNAKTKRQMKKIEIPLKNRGEAKENNRRKMAGLPMFRYKYM